MFQRVGAKALRYTLDNIKRLAEITGNPYLSYPAVHVTGTNGKGTVTHMLASVFIRAGYTTGLYTSPHLVDMRERISVNGVPCEEKFIVEFVSEFGREIERLDASFFEVTTAMAFSYFARKNVDIAIVEVGMGGRLDSTNILSPVLSIITTVHFDHTQYLGNTLREIAREKAGIIKPATPVIVGDIQDHTALQEIENQAKQQEALLIYALNQWSVKIEQESYTWACLTAHSSKTRTQLEIVSDTPGPFLAHNIGITLTALDVLKDKGYVIEEKHIVEGLEKVKAITRLRGRMELVSLCPIVILDIAHNQQALAGLFSYIERIAGKRKYIVVFGMSKDKEIERCLSVLPREYSYIVCEAQVPRALPAPDLAERMIHTGLKDVKVVPSVKEAVKSAMEDAGEEGLVVVTGSAFVVGEAIAELFPTSLPKYAERAMTHSTGTTQP